MELQMSFNRMFEEKEFTKYYLNIPSDDDKISLDGYYSRKVEVEKDIYLFVRELIAEVENLNADKIQSLDTRD